MARQRLPISTILQKSQDWVHPEPDRTYKQVRVRLWGKGLTLRAKVTGANIAAPRQLRVSTGQFLISRIDARHGAFGIVPDHLDGALVTSDFPCFDINERFVLPRYLGWYCRTVRFVDLCRRASEGSTNRVRLKEDRFMEMQFVLPPISEQERIVRKLDLVDRLVDEWKREVGEAERSTYAMLLNGFRSVIEGAPRLPMAEVAPLVRRAVDVEPDGTYSELGVRSFGLGTFHKPDLEGAVVGSKKLYLIREGDLLFNVVFAWEGAVAVARSEDDSRVGSHRFLTCVPNVNVASTDFLRFFFLTPDGIDRLGRASPGGAGRNHTLGLKKLAAIKVPVPQLARQRWFDRMQRCQRDIQSTRSEIEQQVHALLAATLRHELRERNV